MNLHDFVINELPFGYKTVIGENGCRLSGGQRQRLGIARALYKNPQILILDEATSSLDVQTEKLIMDAITDIKDLTIISVAHKPNTLKYCEKIFIFDKGTIKSKNSHSPI